MPLLVPVNRRKVEQAQRHQRVGVALVFQQHTHQRPDLAAAQAVGDLEWQIGLAASPVVQRELTVEQAGAGYVEAGSQIGDGILEKVAQVVRSEEHTSELQSLR